MLSSPWTAPSSSSAGGTDSVFVSSSSSSSLVLMIQLYLCVAKAMESRIWERVDGLIYGARESGGAFEFRVSRSEMTDDR